MRYFKDQWPHLLVSLLGSALSTAFVLGFAWAMLGNRVAGAERRLDEIDKSQVAQMRWQVEQNSAAIAALHADSRQTEAAVAQINTRLGVIEAKLDGIAETIRKSEFRGRTGD